jgi:hypothetical protein
MDEEIASLRHPFKCYSPIPGILHATIESRALGLMHYKPFFSGSYLPVGSRVFPPQIYFNPTHDILYFRHSPNSGTDHHLCPTSSRLQHLYFRAYTSSHTSTLERHQIRNVAFEVNCFTTNFLDIWPDWPGIKHLYLVLRKDAVATQSTYIEELDPAGLAEFVKEYRKGTVGMMPNPDAGQDSFPRMHVEGNWIDEDWSTRESIRRIRADALIGHAGEFDGTGQSMLKLVRAVNA